jgi:hypothetical protein
MGQSLDGEFGMTKILGLAIRTASIICLCFGTLFSTAAVAQDALVIPTWTNLFNADGSLKDAVDGSGAANPNGVRDYVDYGGIDAVFVGDWVSDGVATDMSALSDADNLEEVIVFNGTVHTDYDVGNAFVFATTDGAANPNLVLYGGAERFETTPLQDSYLEFEFIQDKVQAISREVPLVGSRSDDDLLVRLNLSMGALSTADIMRWVSPGGYQVIATITASLSPTGCSGDQESRLACDSYLASEPKPWPQFAPWDDYPRDLSNQPVTVSAPNGLLEFGVNVGALLGTNPDYTSIMVRTPEDIILASFRHLGYWAYTSAGSSGE